MSQQDAVIAAPAPAMAVDFVNGSSRCRYYCFTLNNWTDLELVNIRGAVEREAAGVTCLAFQFEIAPGTGTPHLQGVIAFKHPVTLRGVKGKVPGLDRSHLEAMRGSWEAAQAYCNKVESRAEGTDPEFFGEAPHTGQVRDVFYYWLVAAARSRCVLRLPPFTMTLPLSPPLSQTNFLC